LIEELIRSGHLRKFIEKAAQRNEESSDTTKTQRSPDTEEDKGKDTVRIAVNTIAGGFAGGGESSSTRRRYLHRTGREAHLCWNKRGSEMTQLSFDDNKDINIH
jgi:hypothetical protein